MLLWIIPDDKVRFDIRTLTNPPPPKRILGMVFVVVGGGGGGGILQFLKCPHARLGLNFIVLGRLPTCNF